MCGVLWKVHKNTKRDVDGVFCARASFRKKRSYRILFSCKTGNSVIPERRTVDWLVSFFRINPITEDGDGLPGDRFRSCLHTVLKQMERVKGIEPSCSAWEAGALPLCYTRRSSLNITLKTNLSSCPFLFFQKNRRRPIFFVNPKKRDVALRQKKTAAVYAVLQNLNREKNSPAQREFLFRKKNSDLTRFRGVSGPLPVHRLFP